VSYTLRGRLETRVAAVIAPLLAAAALSAAYQEWWPLQLAALMIGVGLALDLAVYHRAIAYQPAWLALPLGALELALVMGLAVWLGIGAPLGAALAFFLLSWALAQALTHAGLPLLRLSYAEDGGELGRLGPAAAAAALAVLAFAGGVAWAIRPPTIHLSAGVHGPMVLDHPVRLVGEPGAVVRGGITVTSDDVVIRDVTVFGGENGISVDDSERVLLDGVTIGGPVLDGINVRRSSVHIRDCRIGPLSRHYAQGIDISFSIDRNPSMVEGCTIVGGQEGIVTHSANVMVADNWVTGTHMRGITVTEMSMGMVEENRVSDAVGVGIFCGDSSECEIERNRVAPVRPDLASGDAMRHGFGIVAHYRALAELQGNQVSSVRAFAQARIHHAQK
jgi:nitrous oxidase accessory protein NosD